MSAEGDGIMWAGGASPPMKPTIPGAQVYAVTVGWICAWADRSG